MTADDVGLLVRGVAPVVKDYVALELKALMTEVATLQARIADLEARPMPKDGRDGERGADGRDGIDGKDGAAGPVGERGLPGEAGPPGPSVVGPPGEKGADGRDGRDGQPGVPGATGEKGLDGKDGMPGLNGKDGRDAVIENLKATYDGERTVTLCRKDTGEPIEGGVWVFPIPLDRGVYRAELTYAKGDAVSFGGSIFIAQMDQPSKPEDGSGSWRLAVKHGRDGKVVKG